MTRHARRSVTAAAVLLAVAAAGAGAAAAETIRVEVNGLAFVPAEIAAHVGDTVEWVNKDFLLHTATARDGKWDVRLPADASGRIVVKAPGRIEYYCRYHPNMKGVITVAPK